MLWCSSHNGPIWQRQIPELCSISTGTLKYNGNIDWLQRKKNHQSNSTMLIYNRAVGVKRYRTLQKHVSTSSFHGVNHSILWAFNIITVRKESLIDKSSSVTEKSNFMRTFRVAVIAWDEFLGWQLNNGNHIQWKVETCGPFEFLLKSGFKHWSVHSVARRVMILIIVIGR